MQEHMLLHTRQSLININLEIDKYKYTKNKLCTKSFLFTRLYRDARSTKHKIYISNRLSNKKKANKATNNPTNTTSKKSAYLL